MFLWEPHLEPLGRNMAAYNSKVLKFAPFFHLVFALPDSLYGTFPLPRLEANLIRAFGGFIWTTATETCVELADAIHRDSENGRGKAKICS